MGAAKGVKGIVDTADGTIQTVNRNVPIVGDLTKGLGLGGKSEGGSSLLGGLLGSKPEDRDPEEKEKVTEQAKKDLFDTTDKASDAAPIDLQDQEKAAEDARLEVETKSQPPVSETDSKTQLTESTDNLTEISPDDAKIDDTTEKAKGAADDTTEQAKGAADDTTEQAKDTADDTAEQAKDTADEATSKAGDAADEAKETAEDTTSKAGDAADEAKENAEDTTSKAGDVADEAKRLGAKVSLHLYRRTEQEKTAYEHEVELARDEGV